MHILLASSSPRRRDLLESVGVQITCAASGVEELTSHDGGPALLAIENASRKSAAVAYKNPERIVLGADTIVVLDREIFGKPNSLAEAAEMLARLSGRIHEVITGVCIRHEGTRGVLEFHETTFVKFRKLSAAEIGAYLADIDPLDKAGGYAAQDDAGRIIERVEGSLSNVIGLPLERTLEALEQFLPEL